MRLDVHIHHLHQDGRLHAAIRHLGANIMAKLDRLTAQATELNAGFDALGVDLEELKARVADLDVDTTDLETTFDGLIARVGGFNVDAIAAEDEEPTPEEPPANP